MAARCLLLLLLACNLVLADDEFRSRFLDEIGSSTDIGLVAFARRGPHLGGFGRPSLEYSLGVLHSDNDYRGVVSIGPVWQRISYTPHGVFIGELSFAPTLLSAGKFENRDMGGILQFTTGLGLDWKPAPESSLLVGIRLQHISNGSIHRHNPGMDSFGLELTWTPKY